jgi:hypothetical protein
MLIFLGDAEETEGNSDPTGHILFGRFAQQLSGLKEILLGVEQKKSEQLSPLLSTLATTSLTVAYLRPQ